MPTHQCETERLLREALAALNAGTSSGTGGVGGNDLIAALRASHAARQILEQVDVAAVAELQRQGVFAGHGHRKPETALVDLLGIDHADAHRMTLAADTVHARTTLQGETLPPVLPATAAMFAAGSVSLRHISVIAEVMTTRAAERLAPQVWATAESQIAALAADCTPRRLRTLGTDLIEQLDQDGDEPRDEPSRQVNELRLVPLPGGGGKLTGRIEDPVRFDTIRTVLDAKSAPRTADDTRRTTERCADALVDVCGYVADHGDTSVLGDTGGHRPQVTVVVGLDDLENRARAACLHFGDTPTPESLRMLCCDANVIPIVMDGAGQPLDIGRSARTIPPAIRRAVEARDRGCAHPGCDRPASWSEIHHIIPWAHGGPTTLSNLVMLCRVHHREIHSTEWIVRIAPDGIPEFVPPVWIDILQRPRRHPRTRLTGWRSDRTPAEPPPVNRSPVPAGR